MADRNQRAHTAALDQLILRAAERGITDPEVLAHELYEGSDQSLQHYMISIGLQAWMAERRGGKNG